MPLGPGRGRLTTWLCLEAERVHGSRPSLSQGACGHSSVCRGHSLLPAYLGASARLRHFRLVYCRVLSRCGSCDPIGQTPPFMHLEGSPESLKRVSDLEATRSSRSKPWTAEEQGSWITGAVAPATPSVAKDGFQSQLPHGCPWGRAGFYCNSGHPSSSCALTPSIRLAAPCPFILMSQGAVLNACSIFQAGLRKTTRPVQDHT